MCIRKSIYDYEGIRFITREVVKNPKVFRSLLTSKVLPAEVVLVNVFGEKHMNAVRRVWGDLSTEERVQLKEKLECVIQYESSGLKELVNSFVEGENEYKVVQPTWDFLEGYCRNHDVGISKAWEYMIKYHGNVEYILGTKKPFNLEMVKVYVKSKEDYDRLYKLMSSGNKPFSCIEEDIDSDAVREYGDVIKLKYVDGIAGEGSYMRLLYNLVTSGNSEACVAIGVNLMKYQEDKAIEMISDCCTYTHIVNISKWDIELGKRDTVKLIDNRVAVMTRNNTDTILVTIASLDDETKNDWVTRIAEDREIINRCSFKTLVEFNHTVVEMLRGYTGTEGYYNAVLYAHYHMLERIAREKGYRYLAENDCLVDSEPYLTTVWKETVLCKALNNTVGKLIGEGIEIEDASEIKACMEDLFEEEKQGSKTFSVSRIGRVGIEE